MGKIFSKNWFSRNYRALIIGAFLVPIFTVALVSISHVTKWYGISNPVTWAIYLSIGIEIAALSTLAAISADMGKKVYFPFGLVTLVQFIGNIYFAYSFIDINGQSFKDWVDLVSPMVEFMGVDNTDMIGHKRFLAFFAGGMLPIISLSFLHMLVKFTEEDRKKQPLPQPIVDVEKISREVAMIESERERQEKYTPTEEELEKIEQILSKNYENIEQSNLEEKNSEESSKNNQINEYDEKDGTVSKEEFSTIKPNDNNSEQKFSTIESKKENIFQKENKNGIVETDNKETEKIEENYVPKKEETKQDVVKNDVTYEQTQINEVEEKKK
jgi:hypothetical protein